MKPRPGNTVSVTLKNGNVHAGIVERWPQGRNGDVRLTEPVNIFPVWAVERCAITSTAPAWTARQCPECDVWVYVAAGPFSENDPTKTEADWFHWRDKHLIEADKIAPGVTGFPYFPYNEQPVEAVMENRAHD